jgi:hypothetical protein
MDIAKHDISCLHRSCEHLLVESHQQHTINDCVGPVHTKSIPHVVTTHKNCLGWGCLRAKILACKLLLYTSKVRIRSHCPSPSFETLAVLATLSRTPVQRSKRDDPDQSTMVGSCDMVGLRNGVYLLKLGGVNGAEETRERSFAAGSDEELSVASRQCDARHTRLRVCMSTCRSGRPERRPSPPSASRGLLIYLYLDDLSVHDCNPS